MVEIFHNVVLVAGWGDSPCFFSVLRMKFKAVHNMILAVFSGPTLASPSWHLAYRPADACCSVNNPSNRVLPLFSTVLKTQQGWEVPTRGGRLGWRGGAQKPVGV